MSQLSLGERRERFELPGATLQLATGFVNPSDAASLFEALFGQAGWRQDRIVLFGRERAIPRLHRWFADGGQDYSWSGLSMRGEPFPREVEPLRRRVSAACGVELNSALANLYRDGRDSVSWHSDDEPELGERPVIASLSLGAERRFAMRRRDDHSQRFSIWLPSGSLLIMDGETQVAWQHALPKTRRAVGPRINLTFRRIVASGSSGRERSAALRRRAAWPVQSAGRAASSPDSGRGTGPKG